MKENEGMAQDYRDLAHMSSAEASRAAQGVIPDDLRDHLKTCTECTSWLTHILQDPGREDMTPARAEELRPSIL